MSKDYGNLCMKLYVKRSCCNSSMNKLPEIALGKLVFQMQFPCSIPASQLRCGLLTLFAILVLTVVLLSRCHLLTLSLDKFTPCDKILKV